MCINRAQHGLVPCYRLLDAAVVLRKADKEKKERKINGEKLMSRIHRPGNSEMRKKGK